MTEPLPGVPDPQHSHTFARKVRLGTWALFFERLWPRLWLLLGLAALLAILSLTGAFLTLSTAAHALVMLLFAAAALASLVFAARAPWPTREEAIRRIERRSGVAHRPATSYEDTLSANADNPDTKILWQAHRERLARAIDRLKVGSPSPRADRFDPFAVRMLAVLLLVPAAGLATGNLYDRLSSAFRFGKAQAGIDTRVDAWVTPPAYTALPPTMLSDGSQQAATQGKEDQAKLIEVPAKSVVTLRGTGFKGAPIVLEVLANGANEPVNAAADVPKDKLDVAETRFELTTSSRVRALAGGKELGRWTFDVTPDELPKISMDKQWSRTPKGSLKLSYKGEDDYGVVSAVAKVKQLKSDGGDPATAWARAAPLKGPRLPLERPPELSLKIPRSGAKSFEASSLLDLGAHPWAGQKVELWLEATDVAGQVGRSESIEVALPARRFVKPLARAVIEQRRKLAEDSRNRPAVVRALDALTMEPEGFIDDAAIYLGFRTVYHRIERENSREAIGSAVDQLWDLALKIEDGALSNAEKSLKDAQDRLAKALENGADEKEIAALIQELKQAMNKYLEEMQKNASKEGQEDGEDGDQQQLSQDDIDQMMKELEENAENGSREEAERLLAEMKEMMEQLKAGKSAQSKENDDKAKEMMKKLDDLSDLSGEQQKLMDDTFSEDQKGKKQKSGSAKGQQKGQNKNGQSGQQQNADKQGGQQQPRRPGAEEGGEPAGKADGSSGLKDRQSALRKNMEKLQRELEEMGAGDLEKLAEADGAMKRAEESLQEGDLDEATQSQAQALEQMRQTAQQMAQQMAENAQKRGGKKEDKRRDPLDRPQRSEGPDLGSSVKIPDAIDAQRAREILEELRKRSGEALRPPVELDYIDRLLRRF